MAWEQFIVETPAATARVRWADYDTADAWFCRLAQLTSASRLRELDRAGWRDQERGLRDALTAASNAYKLLTLPPMSDPVFRVEWRNAFASAPAVARTKNLLNFMGERGIDAAASAYVAPPLDNPGGGSFLLQPWAWLDDGAQPVFWPTAPSDGGDPNNPRRDYDGLGTGCGRVGSDAQGCDPFAWDVVSWSGPVVTARGYTVLCPPRWTMQVLARVADAGVRRGARALLRDAAAAVALQNARVLNRYHVGSIAELTRTVLTTRAAWEPDAVVQGLQTGLTVAALAANAVPVYGQLASAILGVLAAFVGAFNDDPNATYAMPFMLNGYLPGTEPVDGRLVSPPDARYQIAPPVGASSRCDPSAPDGRPYVATTMGADGTLTLSLQSAPAASWRRAEFTVIGSDLTSRSSLATYPTGDTTIPGLDPHQSYYAQAAVTQTSGDTFVTPLVTTYPVPTAADGADLLRRLALTCAQWLGKTRAQQMDALRTMGELHDDTARAAAYSAVTAYCVGEVGRGGTDIPAAPVTPPAGGRTVTLTVTPGALIPGGGGNPPPPPTTRLPTAADLPAVLRAAGTDCAGWAALAVSRKATVLGGLGLASDAVALAALDAACTAGQGAPVSWGWIAAGVAGAVGAATVAVNAARSMGRKAPAGT